MSLIKFFTEKKKSKKWTGYDLLDEFSKSAQVNSAKIESRIDELPDEIKKAKDAVKKLEAELEMLKNVQSKASA
jgi:hypothetical protein